MKKNKNNLICLIGEIKINKKLRINLNIINSHKFSDL